MIAPLSEKQNRQKRFSGFRLRFVIGYLRKELSLTSIYSGHSGHSDRLRVFSGNDKSQTETGKRKIAIPAIRNFPAFPQA
jgi:hypothetical protein